MRPIRAADIQGSTAWMSVSTAMRKGGIVCGQEACATPHCGTSSRKFGSIPMA
jgi:hypothetical protein